MIGVLFQARMTLTEHYLYKGCKASLAKHEVGKAQKNDQIRAFTKAEIKSTDLCPALWDYCLVVTSGRQLV